MKSFETSTTVQLHGDISIAGVPFAPGTEVEVLISPKRRNADEFAEAWQRVTAELRTLPGADALTEDEINREIDDFRPGR